MPPVNRTQRLDTGTKAKAPSDFSLLDRLKEVNKAAALPDAIKITINASRQTSRLAHEKGLTANQVQKVMKWISGVESSLQEVRLYVEPLASAKPKAKGFREKGKLESSAPRLNFGAVPIQKQMPAFKTARAGAARLLQMHSDEIDQSANTFSTLLARGELLDSASYQQRAGITRQALSKAVGARRMFYIEVGNARAYPAFYLDTRLSRAQVEEVSKLLGDLSGGSKWVFFTTPKGSLASAPKEAGTSGTPRTPLQALRDGDLEKVRQSAIGFAER